VSLELDEHRIYLSDRNRLRAFADALREVVRPDDVVLEPAEIEIDEKPSEPVLVRWRER